MDGPKLIVSEGLFVCKFVGLPDGFVLGFSLDAFDGECLIDGVSEISTLGRMLRLSDGFVLSLMLGFVDIVPDCDTEGIVEDPSVG